MRIYFINFDSLLIDFIEVNKIKNYKEFEKYLDSVFGVGFWFYSSKFALRGLVNYIKELNEIF